VLPLRGHDPLLLHSLIFPSTHPRWVSSSHLVNCPIGPSATYCLTCPQDLLRCATSRGSPLSPPRALPGLPLSRLWDLASRPLPTLTKLLLILQENSSTLNAAIRVSVSLGVGSVSGGLFRVNTSHVFPIFPVPMPYLRFTNTLGSMYLLLWLFPPLGHHSLRGDKMLAPYNG
jgi:hypothetical protein